MKRHLYGFVCLLLLTGLCVVKNLHAENEELSPSPPDDSEVVDIRERLMTKTYDVRDMIGILKDYYDPCLNGDESDSIEICIEEAESEVDEDITCDDLVELIQNTIDPEHWDGTHTIETRNGMITANTTESNQVRIQSLLNSIRSMTDKMVNVTAKVAFCDEKGLQLLEKEAQGFTLKSISEELNKSLTPVAMVKGAGHSTQRFQMSDIKSQAYLKDFTVVITDNVGMLDPDISTLKTGLSVNVRPTCSRDDTYVKAEIRLDHITSNGMKRIEFKSKNINADPGNPEGIQPAVRNFLEEPDATISSVRCLVTAKDGAWIYRILGMKDDRYKIALFKFDIITHQDK